MKNLLMLLSHLLSWLDRRIHSYISPYKGGIPEDVVFPEPHGKEISLVVCDECGTVAIAWQKRCPDSTPGWATDCAYDWCCLSCFVKSQIDCAKHDREFLHFESELFDSFPTRIELDPRGEVRVFTSGLGGTEPDDTIVFADTLV